MLFKEKDSPLLALTEGRFDFESGEFSSCTISEVPLGGLYLPSGRLAIVDPAGGMTRGGNHCVLLEPGIYPMVATMAKFKIRPGARQASTAMMLSVSPRGRVSSAPPEEIPKVAYMSVITNPEGLAARRRWQTTHRTGGSLPPIPLSARRFIHPTLDGNPPVDIDTFEEGEFLGVEGDTGMLGFVDDWALRYGMPPDYSRQHGVGGESLHGSADYAEKFSSGWYTDIFDYGNLGSWFEALDAEHPVPSGLANIPLPLAEQVLSKNRIAAGSARTVPNIILAEPGFGHGVFAIVGEYAFSHDNPFVVNNPVSLLALHLDLGVIPHSNKTPVAINYGLR